MVPPLGGVPALKLLRALGIDQLGALREVVAIEHLRRRHAHRGGLRHVAVGVGEAELHRFDQQVLRGHAVDRQIGECRSARRCPARSAPRCPARWAGSRAAGSRGSRRRSARPTAARSRRDRPRATRRPAPWLGARSPARSRLDRTRSPCVDAIARSAFAWPGMRISSPTSGTRPRGRKTSAKPGCEISSFTANASCHLCWMTTGTA